MFFLRRAWKYRKNYFSAFVPLVDNFAMNFIKSLRKVQGDRGSERKNNEITGKGLNELWNSIKQPQAGITGIPKEKRAVKCNKKIFFKITAKIFLNLKKTINPKM